MKDLQTYLHFYIGCNCKVGNEIQRLTGVSYDGTSNCWWAYFDGSELSYALLSETKPLLRPLSDITEEEIKNIGLTDKQFFLSNIENGGDPTLTSDHFIYLISEQLDLFDLIESNLAFDLTTYDC